MEFKLSTWSHVDPQHPTPAQRAFAGEYGVVASRMAELSPPLVRTYHRMTFDPEVSPRARQLAMLAVVYVVSPLDYMRPPPMEPVKGMLDDVLVVWMALREIMQEDGLKTIQRHWRSSLQVAELVELLGDLDDQIARLPPKVLDQLRVFLAAGNPLH